MKKILVGLLILSLSGLELFSRELHIDGVQSMLDQASLMVTEIEPVGLKKMLDSDDDFYIIDLRSEKQIQRGEIYHVDNLKIDRGYLEFEVEMKVHNKQDKIVVYCCSGKRSLLAAHSLMKMGYKNVYSLKGGIEQWVNDGQALDTKYGELFLKPEGDLTKN